MHTLVLVALTLAAGALASQLFSLIKYVQTKEYRTSPVWPPIAGAIVGWLLNHGFMWIILGAVFGALGYAILDIIIGFIRDKRQ